MQLKNGLINNYNKIKQRACAAALGTVMTAAFITSTIGNFGFGYDVYLDGTHIGTLKSISEAKNLVAYVENTNDTLIDKNFDYSLKLVAENEYTDFNQAVQNIESTDPRFVLSAAVYVDGTKIFSISDKNSANSATQDYLKQYAENGADVRFSRKVDIKSEYAFKDELVSPTEVGELLADAVSVETIIKNKVTEEAPYEVVNLDDSNIYKGDTKLVSDGKNGKKEVTYQIVKVNGQEISKKAVSETVLTPVVNKVVKIGTKEIPKGTATGTFINPVVGSLSSNFGRRWGKTHSGIDIGSDEGTPIYASDGGVVIYSGWMEGYGNLVQIDHQNGYVTYYGHCCKLYVKVGDKVSQGDHISDVGNTGKSTGSHLHFEVRTNGTPVDPLGYVKY